MQASKLLPGSGGVMESQRYRQEALDIQAAQGREIPRRIGVQRRRRRLQFRKADAQGTRRISIRRNPIQGSQFYGTIASWKKIDDYTIEIMTKRPTPCFPCTSPISSMSSPKRWEDVGKDWNKFAEKPSGTGPGCSRILEGRASAPSSCAIQTTGTPTRIPKSDRLVLLPMPDANTRVAALLSGQIDWVEAPPPDAIPRLKQAGMQIVTNIYPHIWPYQISYPRRLPLQGHPRPQGGQPRH